VPDPLRVRGSITIPANELVWQFSRSSGPGGQGVNTTDSRVQLGFDLAATKALGPLLQSRALQRLADRLVDGVVTVTASERRSQWQNRQLAAQRLAALLAEATAPPARSRVATRPTRGSVQRRLESKRRRAGTKRLRRVDPD
jgi:ribosome-associated protein